jgi:hypothetical protein
MLHFKTFKQNNVRNALFYSKKTKQNPFNVKTNIMKELEEMKNKTEETRMQKEFSASMIRFAPFFILTSEILEWMK